MILGEVERVLSGVGVERRGETLVLVACSGGRDSVVLAHAVAELLGGRRVILGHVDHAVRADSDQDALRIERLARALGASARTTRLEPGPASEARLRRLRYEALEAQRIEAGAEVILTAHTEDDQAETVLLALIRSGRPEALAGIQEQRGRIARPLLGVPRREVAAYASAQGLEFFDDPTNVEPRWLRNRIRKELLPLLERRYRRHMARRLARLARVMGRRPSEPTRPPRVLPPQAGGTWPAVGFERRAWQGGPIPAGPRVALFDADVLQRPLVRPAHPGDRIQPFGMEGRRKVRDLLREAGVPVEQRGSFPVVADDDGRVLWVPGAVRADAYQVGPLTRHVWVFWMNDSDKLRAGSGGVTVDSSGSRSSEIEGSVLTKERRAACPRDDEE